MISDSRLREKARRLLPSHLAARRPRKRAGIEKHHDRVDAAPLDHSRPDLVDRPRLLLRGEIEAAFRKAQPHIDEFRKHVKAGWEKKKVEDNDGANECWIDAKKEFQKATQIVNELLEDEDRFPTERPGVDRFLERLGTWQREMADLPKVNMTR